MEDITQIRNLEQLVIQDSKKVNSLLPIKQFLKNEEKSKDVRIAALHALRRIFVHLIDGNRFSTSNGKGADSAENQYRHWLVQQLDSYLQILRELISSSDVTFQTPAIRTMIEFVRREHVVTSTKPVEKDAFTFGVNTYQSLIESILNMSEIDVEILLMAREEIFSKPDCAYYSLLVLKDVLVEKKDLMNSTEAPNAEVVRLMQNSLDLIRVIQVPDEGALGSKKSFLAGAKGLYIDDDGLNDDDADSDEEDSDVEDVKETKLAAGFTNSKKRVFGGKSQEAAKKKSRSRLSRAEQLKTVSCYRKVFSKAWLALLRMPLTNNQHKLALKHLPEYVMGQLEQPLLLADYLTRSYDQGGVVAVLALESLFQLIVQKNLDYPNFFVSLYRLCTAEVFSAKYRSKFMKLLSASLKSTNLPVYLVAAFSKRLSQLALRVPAPSALFCLAQVTWLLRRHQQCVALLHRSAGKATVEAEGDADGYDDVSGNTGAAVGAAGSTQKKNAGNGSGNGSGKVTGEFDPLEEFNLEKANAAQSSLWELEALSQHHLHSVATFARSLETASSTSTGTDAPYLRVEDFIEHSYAALMETELASTKKHSAMAYKQPAKLLLEDDLISKCFGSA